MEPTTKKPDEDSCDVSYRLILDRFEVRGRNFLDVKLGADGGGLKKEIEGCGALTSSISSGRQPMSSISGMRMGICLLGPSLAWVGRCRVPVIVTRTEMLADALGT